MLSCLVDARKRQREACEKTKGMNAIARAYPREASWQIVAVSVFGNRNASVRTEDGSLPLVVIAVSEGS